MALVTLGSNATNTLSAFVVTRNPAAADVGTMRNAIKDDQNVAHPIYPGAYNQTGQLYIPNRGVLIVLPGDYIAWDSRGWPILVSADAIASGPWTHT